MAIDFDRDVYRSLRADKDTKRANLNRVADLRLECMNTVRQNKARLSHIIQFPVRNKNEENRLTAEIELGTAEENRLTTEWEAASETWGASLRTLENCNEYLRKNGFRNPEQEI